MQTRHVGPDRITEIAPASVTDPIGDKVGLPTTSRLMWVIYGDDTIQRHHFPAGARNPVMTSPNPGTVTHVYTLIDDATLRLGGNFTC